MKRNLKEYNKIGDKNITCLLCHNMIHKETLTLTISSQIVQAYKITNKFVN